MERTWCKPLPAADLLITGGRVVDPESGLDDLLDVLVGDGAKVGARCELLRGARVWPGVELPDNGIRFSTDV